MSEYTKATCPVHGFTGFEDGLCQLCIEDDIAKTKRVLAAVEDELEGIVELESCIVQYSAGGAWTPAVFKEYIFFDDTLYFYVIGIDQPVAKIAPMEGNRDAIGSVDADVWDLWDMDRGLALISEC